MIAFRTVVTAFRMATTAFRKCGRSPAECVRHRFIMKTVLCICMYFGTNNASYEEPERNPSVLNSAHWITKMKTIFLTLDTDHDGFITLEDNQASPIRMVRAFGLSKEKADAVLEYTRRVGWVEYVNAGVEQPDGHRVSEQTFIKNMARAVDSQKDVGKDLAECHLILFDLEEPGFLSREEYLKVFGTQQVDEAVSVRRFEMLDSDQDGRIKVDDYVDDIRFFFTDVGPSGSGDDERNDPHRNNIFGELVTG